MLGCLDVSNSDISTNQAFMTEVIDIEHLWWGTGSALDPLCFWAAPWLVRHNNSGHVQILQALNKTVCEMYMVCSNFSVEIIL